MSHVTNPVTYFTAPLLDQTLQEIDVDISAQPYFYNNGGTPEFLADLSDAIELISASSTNASMSMGHVYAVPEEIETIQTDWGEQTQLAFAGNTFEFMPLKATPETAAAFGMTLVKAGQAIAVVATEQMLSQIEYRYGMMAGHFFPYDSSQANLTEKTLYPFVITDLEHHDFPHVFASTDPNQLPLVISVGRYFPKDRKIYLADLWVEHGDALYIPEMPKQVAPEFVDLHNNRNAALACWKAESGQSMIQMHTLLDPKGYFYWFWNACPTIHPQLDAFESTELNIEIT